MRKIFDIIVFMVGLLLMVVAAGCGRSEGRLQEIDALAEVDAAGALAALDSIEAGELGKSDRMLYELIRLKAQDKAYVRQESDSVATMLAEYFRGSDREAEALYYCGRVNCDLGDYPTALRYFQDALDANGHKNLKLRSNITSQIGGLLNDLRLYEEAIPYLEETIELNKKVGDTIYEALDYQLLGAVLMHLERYDSAEENFRKALARTKDRNDSALFQGYLAATEHLKGNNYEALNLISGLEEKSHERVKNFIRAYTAEIYLRLGQTDSALHYAKKLVDSNKVNNAITGYKIIFYPEIRRTLSQDSISHYLEDYLRLLEQRYDQNNSEGVISQTTKYNYTRYEKENIRLIEKVNISKHGMIIGIVLLIGLLLIVAGLRIVNSKRKEALRSAINKLRALQIKHELLLAERDEETAGGINKELVTDAEESVSEIISAQEERVDCRRDQKEEGKDLQQPESIEKGKTVEEGNTVVAFEPKSKGNDNLKNELLKELEKMIQSGKAARIRSIQKSSGAYKLVNGSLSKGEGWKEKDPRWDKLDKEVRKMSATFRSNITLLSGGKITKQEYQYALLIMAGLNPTESSRIIKRDKGAITYRRRNLCKKVLLGKYGLDRLDDLILSL